MDDVLVLVQPRLVQNDIGDFVPAGPPLKQQIFGSINSVNRAEWYSAGQEGRKPELVFTTPIINYSGQPEADYHGTRYSIYRTYLRQGSDEMELYLEHFNPRSPGGERPRTPAWRQILWRFQSTLPVRGAKRNSTKGTRKLCDKCAIS